MFDDPRWGDDPRDRDDDPRDPERDRDDDDAGPHIGRGPSSHTDKSEPDSRDRDDERRPERDRDSCDLDPRDVFMRDLDLPRGREREIVHDPREREYTLRGSETRTLSTVGAFRVVPARDLRDHSGREADPRSGDLRHLREQGLISTVRLDGRRDVAVVTVHYRGAHGAAVARSGFSCYGGSSARISGRSGGGGRHGGLAEEFWK